VWSKPRNQRSLSSQSEQQELELKVRRVLANLKEKPNLVRRTSLDPRSLPAHQASALAARLQYQAQNAHHDHDPTAAAHGQEERRRPQHDVVETRAPYNQEHGTTSPSDLSLIEELFPEERERREASTQVVQQREIPRIPLELSAKDASEIRRIERELEVNWRNSNDEDSVLVLRNASINLVEEDFRGLIPEGKHIDGWKLEKGDIVKGKAHPRTPDRRVRFN